MARFRVNDNGMAFDVYLDDKLRIRLGRAEECEVTLEDGEASRVHCEVTLTDGGFVLVDQNSSNGTRVNGRPVRRHPLRDGDVVAIGKARIKFADPDEVERLKAAAAAGVVPSIDLNEPEPQPQPRDRPAGGNPKRPSGRQSAASGRRRSPSGRQRSPSGRQRSPSGRGGGRRRSSGNSALIGGGLLVVGLVVMIFLVMGAKGRASRQAVDVLDAAKRRAKKGDFVAAIRELKDMPSGAPANVVAKAKALQDEWKVGAKLQRQREREQRKKAAAVGVGGMGGMGGLSGAGGAGAAGTAANAAAFEALREADATANAAQGEYRYGDALAAYDAVLKAHPDSEAAAQCGERRKKLLDAAQAEWTRRQDRAKAHLNARRFDEARALYQEVADRFGLPDFIKLAKQRLDYVNDVAMQ